ncbi:MAG: 1-deoxy-D-xylulose-5-phosphate reductoisomerase [FCB group bacterium]|nr:1-deoxy-D-xylulose-5-phosphate reductoisomerase [FCB group bacterium]
MRKISILGSTGSIGLNALKVVENLQDQFEVVYLSCQHNGKELLRQAKQFRPKAVAVTDIKTADEIRPALASMGIELQSGREGLVDLAARDDVDIVLNGIVGAAGMEPTYRALSAGVDVALSNKESLVMAGDLLARIRQKSGARLFPVDSEHSAIWQCLSGENPEDIRRLILTGSGGPFRTRPRSTFPNITVAEALKHPNWNMGAKITIDSATMMNKGLEVIEAYWLFQLPVEKIDIIIHPQSIIHSMVEFQDASVKAQLGVPDMKVPIQYALTWPRHSPSPWERLDLLEIGTLTFEPVDRERFPAIELAYEALRRGGTSPAALNVANEQAVYRFLAGEIGFMDIPKIIEHVLESHTWKAHPDLDDFKVLEQNIIRTVSRFSPSPMGIKV